jgi:hypothetical protein
MRKLTRVTAVIGGGVSAAMTSLTSALAQTADPNSAVTGAAATVRDSLVSIATTVLPYAAAVFAIVVGWRLAKRFIGGK